MTVGRGIRFEGNFRVRDVRVFLDASAWYIIRRGLVLSSQLERLATAQAQEHCIVPEGLQFIHFIDRCFDRNVQHHGIVRYSPFRELVHIHLSPFAYELERLDIACDVPRHQCVESHGERTAPTVPFRPTILVTDFRV